ncbi:hypothetical protein JX265_001614 [Neoarthrinium moseri]|uniref:RRM domain-containing protein n=1 Tax=Neoarthrinium moseri TaxID=1658444 RepID=A0A9Q0AUS2_9PEZI|nr:hypothetical protein JX265_001614 [Neoarthrinium moseri]
MAKRKAEDNPTTVANGEVTETKKRQRVSEDESSTKRSKKDKKDKKSKKERKVKEEAEAEEAEETLDLPMADVEDTQPEKVKQEPEASDAAATDVPTKSDKSKKKKKNKKGAKAGQEDAAATETQEQAEPEVTEETTSKPKKSRFIVFVGNLPYSATVPDIEKHFSAVQPTSVRLLHEKTNPNKSRGIAFVEFAGFDHMKTCLKTLHHSTFKCQGRDHRGRPKPEERVINVELTAGGGGNTAARKEKIKAKNEKLDGERERRALEEERVRIKKEKERLTKEGEKKGGADGIHPSRRGRVPGSSK